MKCDFVLRTQIVSIVGNNYNDTNFKNAGVIISDKSSLAEFKNIAPELVDEYCVSVREYNYGNGLLLLIHTSMLIFFLNEMISLYELGYINASKIHLDQPVYCRRNEILRNYVNCERSDNCQFYTVNRIRYDNDIGSRLR